MCPQTTRSVRLFLGSTVPAEVRAAIFAADHLCASSASFTKGTAHQIADLIHALETPQEHKLKLIVLLRHFHHDAVSVAHAQELCASLLQTLTTKPFVLALLASTTHLVLKSMIGVGEHINLLLQYLDSDSRSDVQITALGGLRQLARRMPRFWTPAALDKLTKFLSATPSAKLLYGGLRVVEAFTATHQGTALLVALYTCSEFAQHLQAFTGHVWTSIAILSCKALCHLACSSQTLPAKDQQALVTFACDATCTALARCAASYTLIQLKESTSVVALEDASADAHLSSALTKELMACPYRLASLSQQSGTVLVELLIKLFEGSFHGPVDVLLAKCLQRTLAYTPFDKTSANQLLQIAGSDAHRVDARKEALAACVAMSFGRDTETVQRLAEILQVFVDKGINWPAYFIARRASCIGCYSLAVVAFGGIKQCASSEHYTAWLTGLEKLCHAETMCARTDAQQTTATACAQLLSAAGSFQAALTAFRAAVQPSARLRFQLRYLQLRMDMARLLGDVIKFCTANLRRKTKASVDSAAPLFLRLVDFLTQCGALRRSFFDLDAASLRLLEAMERAFVALGHMYAKALVPPLEAQLPLLLDDSSSSSGASAKIPLSDSMHCEIGLQEVYNKTIAQLGTQLRQETGQLEAIELVGKAAAEFTSVPVPLPPFFFWNGTPTTVQIFFTGEDSSDVLEVPVDTDFVLVAEGFVRLGYRTEMQAQDASQQKHQLQIPTVDPPCASTTTQRKVAAVILNMNVRDRYGLPMLQDDSSGIVKRSSSVISRFGVCVRVRVLSAAVDSWAPAVLVESVVSPRVRSKQLAQYLGICQVRRITLFLTGLVCVCFFDAGVQYTRCHR